MQPGPSDADQVNLSTETPVGSQEEYHHGRLQDQHLQLPQQCSARLPCGGEGGDDGAAGAAGGDDGEANNKTRETYTQGESCRDGLRGLRSRALTTPQRKAYPSINRITEYERARSSPSPPRSDAGPAFRVVGKGKIDGASISIYKFPNGKEHILYDRVLG
jgi:hypothetical protein